MAGDGGEDEGAPLPEGGEEVGGDAGFDEAMEKASIKIQSVHRGKASRKEVERIKSGKEQASTADNMRSSSEVKQSDSEAARQRASDLVGDENLIQAYLDAVAAAKRPVNKLVERSIVESRLQGDGYLSIAAPGNYPTTFSSRISDDDARILCEVFRPATPILLFLDLSYNHLTDVGVEILASTFLGPQAETLEVVCLKGNSIGDQGCKTFCKAAMLCPNLSRVDISQNPIGRAGGLAVVELLKANSMLQELVLGDTEIDIDPLVALAAALLDGGQQLKILNVENPRINTLQEEHTVHLGRMLRTNTGLTEVYLGKHRMRDAGVQQLVGYLLENKTLRVLDLRCNEIGAAGAESLALLLRSDCQLVQLNLESNRIGEMDNVDGAAAIATALVDNRMLSHIDLNHNSLCGKALQSLANAVDENTTLESVALFHNTWDQPASYKFHQILNDRARVFPIAADFVTSEVDLRIDVCQVHDFKKATGMR